MSQFSWYGDSNSRFINKSIIYSRFKDLKKYTAVFKKRNGDLFYKSFNSFETRKKAVNAYKNKGGFAKIY